MHLFPIKPLSRFLQPPTVTEPREIACFSFDENRKLHLDSSQLRYYYPAKLGTDLSTGFPQKFRQREEGPVPLESVLTTLVEHEKKTGRIYWEIDDTIFIEDGVTSEQKQKEVENWTRQQRLAVYMGYKFETVSTLSKPWEEACRTEIETRNENLVDNSPQYASVVKYRIGDVRLILGGEVDCVWDYKPDPPENPLPHYVELKTSKALDKQKDRYIFERHKLVKFWAQSFLLGVPRIIVGYKSQSGLLQSLQTFETQKIPGIIKKSCGNIPCDPNTALSFAERVLKWVKINIPKGNAVWRLQYLGGEGVEIYKLPETETVFVTKEFIEWRRSQRQSGGVTQVSTASY